MEKEECILRRSDFRLYTATSSDEAIALHRKEKVDLIIIDMDMPVISGDKFCSLIRKDDSLKQVSVILICGTSSADIDRFTKCGANAYLVKPLRPVELLEKVSQLLDIPERKSYRVLLKVKVNGRFTSDTFFCSSQNISSSGILLQTDKLLEKGDIITCSFFLPSSERIVAEGEVVRAAKNSGDTYQYGIRFLSLDDEFKTSIETFIGGRSGGK
ncbi:MAG: response regulator [Nitrospirae bacterium]|nr:response regulator [Nitrospirota bacterium]